MPAKSGIPADDDDDGVATLDASFELVRANVTLATTMTTSAATTSGHRGRLGPRLVRSLLASKAPSSQTPPLASLSLPVRRTDDVLLPASCPICHRPGPAPCADCRAELRSAGAAPLPTGVDGCVAVLAYEGAGRELIARLKYRNARSSLAWLAEQMARAVDPAAVDVVTWVPTTADRRRQRGFDQAELLARHVARRLRRPCRELLARRGGPPQTGRDAAARRQGPALVARHRGVPLRVLLVDDVITTGSTVTAAARTLRDAGVSVVLVCAGARTSLKRAGKASDTCL